MLARIAQELFWLGRNLARAESTARLLDCVFAADLQGRPEDPSAAHLGWDSLVHIMGGSRNGKLAKLEKKEPKPITTLVMSELKEPRETFLFIKGDFTRPSDRVLPGVPAVLHSFRADGVARRANESEESHAPSSPLTPGGGEGARRAGEGVAQGEPGPNLSVRPPNRLDLANWID